MKRKAKVRRRRDGPPLDSRETAVEPSTAPATPERISIESVDERKTGSIESVPQTEPENVVVGLPSSCCDPGPQR
jgi:hypothetical protein